MKGGGIVRKKKKKRTLRNSLYLSYNLVTPLFSNRKLKIYC